MSYFSSAKHQQRFSIFLFYLVVVRSSAQIFGIRVKAKW